MTKLISWIKDNKLASFLLLVVFLFLVGSIQQSTPRLQTSMVAPAAPGRTEMAGNAGGSVSNFVGKTAMPPYPGVVPSSDTASRMVTTDTSLSLKVDDVSQSISQIEGIANQAGGYLIDSNLSKPEGAASGSISIRIPTGKRNEVLASMRGVAVKVVSENISGQDITDQYVDNDERLRILNEMKFKFENILANAKAVSDMLEVQRELLNVQSQIDALKGQQKYLEGSTKMSRITAYLSTDELALPYAPDTAWRPASIFKNAVRSVVLTLRSFGSALIWVAVYTPIVLIGGLIIWVITRVLRRK